MSRRRARWRPALALALVLAGVAGTVQGLRIDATVEAFAGPVGDCRVGDRLTPHRGDGEWAWTLLDQEYGIEPGYAPMDLVSLTERGIPGNASLRAFVLDDLAALIEAASRDGVSIRVTSAYRSFAQQRRTFASLEATFGQDEALRSAARPGHSEHQLGTTVDADGGDEWLAEHAWEYGFVVSYQPEHSPWSTCYKPEPWHLRYVGRDAARDVSGSGLSLRAWLWSRQ